MNPLFPLDDLLDDQTLTLVNIEDDMRRAIIDACRSTGPLVRLMSEYEFWQGVSLGVVLPAPWVKIVLIPNGNE